MSIRIDFLSYEGERNNERHPHAQFVLPIAGELEISIGGAEGRLTPSCAAFVAPGVRIRSWRPSRTPFLSSTAILPNAASLRRNNWRNKSFFPFPKPPDT